MTFVASADRTTRYADPQADCVDHEVVKHNERQPHWSPPAYPGMIGNVHPEFLTFSGNPFPIPPMPDQPFPTLRETYDYLKDFSRPLLEQGKIRLNHEVVRVEEIDDSNGGGWGVVIKDWSGGGVEKEELWDAVVVATVWFDNPHFPNIDGLDTIMKAGKARHAISWAGPSGYEGKVLLSSIPSFPSRNGC